MKRFFTVKLLLASMVCLFPIVVWGQASQTVRGRVLDRDSKYPVIGATVIVPESDPIIGSSTDVDGYFELRNVPLGRLALRITAIGYRETLSTNLVVVAGKELQIDFELEESIEQLAEIEIRAADDKLSINNDLATVSARSFDMEQTARFAGSRNDPARMATNFAGVSGANDARNDVIIRGNSPSGVLWRLEGIDIPSPNHFASFGSTGGPVSMLNYNNLARSDFMTAAFPAGYGNALAGVFDLRMRNGNNRKHEFLGQVGFNGFELGAEGPIKQGGNASYLANYRYSTLGVFQALGINFGTGAAVPEYQDLNFKINLPTANGGRWEVWGMGGLSQISLLGSEVDLDNPDGDLFGNENEDIYNDTRTGVVGVAYTQFLSKNTSLKLSLAASQLFQGVEIDSVSREDRRLLTRYRSLNFRQNKYSAHLVLNSKINTRNTVVAGLMAEAFDLVFADSALATNGWYDIRNGNGLTQLTQAYVTWQHKFNDKLVLNTGAHSQYFGLSQSFAVEPRVGLKYQAGNRQSFNFGYGMHHQTQLLPIYYVETQNANGSVDLPNKNLDFTRSQHFALGHDVLLLPDLRLKTEVYYQWIDRVPVHNFPSTFSLLNAGADFGTPEEAGLVNQGAGRNYGLEVTLEKFFAKQYYFLLTTSLFDSKYKASDGVWRNTAFNGQYVVNLLAGKEWTLGQGNNTLSIDWKVTSAGGRFYTPVDLVASAARGVEVLDQERAFAEQLESYFRADVKIAFRMNRKKATHEWALDVQNVSNRDNPFRRTYNTRTNTVGTEYQLGIFPVPQYRLLF